MSTMENVQLLFTFIGGLGMFLYGMNVMADGLQKSAGDKMKRLLQFLTNNRFVAVLVGLGVTAIIQSSSATTVMVVGFVNAGIMTLGQAVGVIMGANIGTTVTSWLVSMSEWGSMLQPETIAPLLIGVGAFMMLFCHSEKKREAAEILVGFGVLFVGLSFMSDSITPYKDAPIFATIFRVLGSNPLLGILAGVIVTGIIQSSSASVGILQTLAMNGVVTWNSAIFITLGQNIGTCVTALISSIGAQKTAKRAAVIHLLFNVIGTVIFGIGMTVLFFLLPELAVSKINSVEISIFHTVFNLTNTIILFPFANYLVKLSEMIVRDKKGAEAEEEEAAAEQLPQLDDRMMETPSFAIANTLNETIRMSELAIKHVNTAIGAVLTGNEKRMEKSRRIEDAVNEFEKLLMHYLEKLHNLSLTEGQSKLVGDLMYTVKDVERISDHCDNITELAEDLRRSGLSFSGEAQEDLKEMTELSVEAIQATIDARRVKSRAEQQQCIDKVTMLEEEVDSLRNELRDKHMERLAKNQCSTVQGILYLDILSNMERISDHALNIAKYIANEIEEGAA